MHIALLLSALLLAAPASLHAQEADDASGAECQAADLNLADAAASEGASRGSVADAPSLLTDPTPATTVTPTSPAAERVQSIIQKDGVHVVHFWAPWCSNAKNELAAGWGALVEANPNVSFTFVSIWNDGEPAQDVLAPYDIPDRVVTLTQPDPGPSDNEAERRRRFLGLPVTWSPSTWIFHQNGELAFALNYGEMPMDTVQSLLDATQADW
jgi:thiol-disulfide isomerase/thioredoxin